jgi:Rad3-related DNA helicase
MEQNRKTIAEYNQKSKQLISTMKLSDMTMNQLRSSASSLREQLNNTSKAASPEAYKQLQKEIKDVENQMGKLSGRSKSLCDTLNTMRGVLLATIATKFGQKIQEWAKSAIDFIKEGIEMAATAEGIKRAFDVLGKEDLLAELRKQTKGLTSDLNLMQATVKASK